MEKTHVCASTEYENGGFSATVSQNTEEMGQMATGKTEELVQSVRHDHVIVHCLIDQNPADFSGSAYPMMTMSTCEEKKIETLDVCFPAMKGEVHFAAKSHGAKPIMVGRRDRWPRCLREATMRGKDLKHVRAKVIRFACNCIPYFLDRGRIFTIM